jgi:hypothetical protein
MDPAGADDHGLAVALRRRTAALVTEWDSLVCAYLAATSGREEAEAEAGFGDDCLPCPFEPEAEAVEDEVLLRRVACGCFPLNCGVSVDASTAVSSPRILGIAKLIVAIEFFGSSEVLCSSLLFLVSCPVVDDEVCLDQLRPPPDASHGEEVPCVGFITREGVTTQPGTGHGDEDTCAAPEDAGHGEGVTTWQCASHEDEDACVALAITTPEDAG